MSLIYTNRKDKTYFLCQGVTKNGNPRYFFSREPQGTPLDALPDGYVIQESINGVVSLAKQQPGQLSEQEITAVTSALAAHPKTKSFRAEVRHKVITLYEREWEECEQLDDEMDYSPLFLRKLQRASEEKRLQFSPIMRFTLVDVAHRYFVAERMRFSGMTRWITVSAYEPIDKLAPRLIAVLGTDQFYELYPH